jgi:hypothetical protein
MSDITTITYPAPVSLDEWERTNPPYSQQIGYRDGFWEQLEFVRVQLHGIFAFTEQQDESPILVVGAHANKSSLLPVYSLQLMTTPGSRQIC